jgi:glycosyltransferase involved in cell wall biosynthesis
MIFLSIVIPTYNRRESLLRTLRALENQSYAAARFEVIVISDGSQDGTSEAVADLKMPYRLRFIAQENQGPSVARNHGAQVACAPVLVYLDDDIEPCTEFLAVHAAAHEFDTKLVLIGPQSGPMHERMPPWIAWEHLMLQKQYRNFINGVWSTGPNNLYSGNFSLRREHLLAVGGFNVQFTRQEDVELGFRLEKYGLHFQFNARADGIHRPTRTFASWYKTPYEYGRRDVQMSRDMGEGRAITLARRHFRERNRLTQVLARLCIGRGWAEATVLAIGRIGAQYAGRRLALPICSLLFNLRYLQGMCRELGGREQLWQFMSQ